MKTPFKISLLLLLFVVAFNVSSSHAAVMFNGRFTADQNIVQAQNHRSDDRRQERYDHRVYREVHQSPVVQHVYYRQPVVYPRQVTFLPAGYRPVWIKGHQYYYCDGRYYTAQRGNYVLVDEPGFSMTIMPNSWNVSIGL